MSNYKKNKTPESIKITNNTYTADIFGTWIKKYYENVKSIELDDKYIFTVHDDGYTKMVAIDKNKKWIQGRYLSREIDINSQECIKEEFLKAAIVSDQMKYNISNINDDILNIKTKKEKAIAVYMDDSNKMESELSWLYKTWKYHKLDKEYDLVVFFNPSGFFRIEKFKGIVSIPMYPIRYGIKRYKFLNSHYFCLPEYATPLKKYKYILKTDCDVFLTKNLLGFTPSKFIVGLGGFYIKQITEYKERKKLEKCIQELSEELCGYYENITDVGASFFGETKDVLRVVNEQIKYTELILSSPDIQKRMSNAGHKIGIASMIGGQIAVNKILQPLSIQLYLLDCLCWKTQKIGSSILHIHAWHNAQPWSKHAYFEGKYKDWIVDESCMYDSCADYCHYFAQLPLENVLTKNSA